MMIAYIKLHLDDVIEVLLVVEIYLLQNFKRLKLKTQDPKTQFLNVFRECYKKKYVFPVL